MLCVHTVLPNIYISLAAGCMVEEVGVEIGGGAGVMEEGLIEGGEVTTMIVAAPLKLSRENWKTLMKR